MAAQEWVSVARSCPHYNYQQSPAYSLELAKRRRASCEFIYVTDAHDPEHIIGVASVRVRTAPVVGGGLAYISAGPLLVRAYLDDGVAFQLLLDALVTEYVHRRGLCLRLTVPTADPAVSRQIAEWFTDSGFRIARIGASYRTALVDLRQPMDAIRATLNRKWRNQLTAALRGAVSVELSEDARAVLRFAPLLEETSQRKGFTTELGAAFYDRVQQLADTEDRMLVAIAREGDADVAGVVASVLGDTAVYILGATTADGMKSKAAYALHWQVMATARDSGCRWYDLGGIDPETNPGVYHFKSGFGGSDVVVPGPFEHRPPGFAGVVSRVAEASYATVKRWRS